MKSLLVNGQQFGPFESIEVMSDRYICDHTVYFKSVVGEADTGEYVAPPPPPPKPPQTVTMRQARLALLGAGLLSQVDAAIAALPSPQKEAAQIEWEYAATVERGSPLIGQLAPALGMTEAEMDQLFIEASLL